MDLGGDGGGGGLTGIASSAIQNITITPDEAISRITVNYNLSGINDGELSYVDVILTQILGTSYTNNVGEQIYLDESYTKRFTPSYNNLTSIYSDSLVIDKFYDGVKYIVDIVSTYSDNTRTNISEPVTNTSSQYVSKLQTTPPIISNVNKTTEPKITFDVTQKIIQKVQGEWDDTSIKIIEVNIFDGTNSIVKPYLSNNFKYFNNNNERYVSISVVLTSSDISFDTTYYISANSKYRDATYSDSSDIITITPISPSITINDIYDFIRNDQITCIEIGSSRNYYKNTIEYIRSSEEVAYRKQYVIDILTSRGVTLSDTSYNTIISALQNIIDNDTGDAQNTIISYIKNGVGLLYRFILCLAADANNSITTLINYKKYVVGENIICDFNNVSGTRSGPSKVIYTDQFKNTSTQKFHKVIRLDIVWDAPLFADQLSRVDAGAFNPDSIVVMRERVSTTSYAVFNITGAGNIELDPVHFPHIANNKQSTTNPLEFYNDKLFIIGHALMPGAPIYTSFNKKIVDMNGTHVFNLNGDTIYTLGGVVQFKFSEITANIFSNTVEFRYDRDTGIIYNTQNQPVYKAIDTFYTPIAVETIYEQGLPISTPVFNKTLKTWDYIRATTPSYDTWYVSYIPPNYFRKSAITETIVSWEASSTGKAPLLRDTIYIGDNAFPPTCTLSLPTPYLDNALTPITNTNISGGTISEILNKYIQSGTITVVENNGVPTLQSNISVIPSNFLNRATIQRLNIRYDHQFLRIPPQSLPIGCNILRNGKNGTVLPGYYSYPFSTGTGPSIYTAEIAQMPEGLVVYSGIVYKNYDSACEILWLIDASGLDITFPPVPLRIPDYWAISFRNMTIPNVEFTCGETMFYGMLGKLTYSGITYKPFSNSNLQYDRVPTMSDADRLSGTVRILNIGENGTQSPIKTLPSIFATYTGIDTLVLPLFMDININSMKDGQVFECDTLTWRHDKTSGYPILLKYPNKQNVKLLPYVNLYDSIFENQSSLRSVGPTPSSVGPKIIGPKAFKNCSNLESINFILGDIGDEAFYKTTSLKSLQIGRTITRLGDRVFYGSGITTLTIDSASGITLTPASLEGANNLKTLIVKNIPSSFTTNIFASLTNLTSLQLEFTATAKATIGKLNAPNLESVILTGNIVSLDPSIFQNCTKLKSITIDGSIVSLADSMFEGTSGSLEYLYARFKGAESVINCQFKNFTKLREVHYIGDDKQTCYLHSTPFTGCTALTVFDLNMALTSGMSDNELTGDIAFGGCVSLPSVSLTYTEGSMKTMSCKLAGLSMLEKFDIRGPCKLTDTNILAGASSLKTVDIAGELHGSIDSTTAQNIEVYRVTYGGSNSEISDYAFINSKLKQLEIRGTITRIGVGAFYNCIGLTTLNLPEGLKELDDFAFARSGISGELVIPSTVKKLGAGYFIGCNNITKVVYNCSVLYFTNPFAAISNIWNILNKPANTTFDISGEIYTSLGSTKQTFDYTNLADNTTASIPLSTYKKQMNLDQFRKRKIEFYNILTSIKKRFTELSSIPTETRTSNETKWLGAYYRMIDKLSESKVDPSYIFNTITPTLDIYLTDERSLINDDTLTYTDINKYIDEFTKYNNNLFTQDTAIGVTYKEVTVAYTLPHNNIRTTHNNIRTTLQTDKITNIIGTNTIISENNQIYLEISGTEVNIILDDSSIIKVKNGTVRVNLANLIDSTYSNILYSIANELSNTETTLNDATEVDFSFEGKLVTILSLTDLRNCSILVNSEYFEVYDFGMTGFMDVRITINSTAVKLYDNAFHSFAFSSIIITCNSAICGKDLFLNGDSFSVSSSVPLVNRTNTKVVNFADKKLTDIESITGINKIDTRNFGIETFIPANETKISNSLLVLKFQQKSTLTYHYLIMQPEDWFWCYRLDPVLEAASGFDPDFSATSGNSRRFKYMPESAYLNPDGSIKITDGRPTPDEYSGLTSNFAPDSFTYNGLTFNRTTSKNSASDVLLRAVFSPREEAADERLKKTMKLALNVTFMVLSIATAFIPIAPLIGGIIAVLDVANSIAWTVVDSIDEAKLSSVEYTYERSFDLPTRGLGAFLKVTIKKIGSGICTIYTVIKKSTGAVISRIIRRPGPIGTHTVHTRTTFSYDYSAVPRYRMSIKYGDSTPDLPLDMVKRQLIRAEHRMFESTTSVSLPKVIESAKVRPVPAVGWGKTDIITSTKIGNAKQFATTTKIRGVKKSGSSLSIIESPASKSDTLRALNNVQDPSTIRSFVPNEALDSIGTAKILTQTKKSTAVINRTSSTRITFRNDTMPVINSILQTLKDMVSSSFKISLPPLEQYTIKDFMADSLTTLLSVDTTNNIPLLKNLYTNCFDYLYKAFTDDLTSIEAATNIINTMKTSDDTITNIDNVTMMELATYNSYVSQYISRPEGLSDHDIRITDDIETVVRTAALVKKPPYLFPLTAPSRYNEGARADTMQHYTSQQTNADYNSLETDIYNFQNGANRMANALMARREYMFKGTFTGPAISASSDNLQTQSVGDKTILVCNGKNDEVYLGNRPVVYTVSIDEVPNNVFCGASNITINIPEGVTNISDYAFCSTDGTDGNLPFNITSIILPTSLAFIGTKAFYRAGVKNVFFPTNINLLSVGSFSNCGLINAIQIKSSNTYDIPKNITISLKPTTEITVYNNNIIFRGFESATILSADNTPIVKSGMDVNGAPAVISIFGANATKISNVSKADRIRRLKYTITTSSGKIEVDTDSVSYRESSISSFEFLFKEILRVTTTDNPRSFLISDMENPTVNNVLWNDRSNGIGNKYYIELTNSSQFTFTNPTKIIYSDTSSVITRNTLRNTGTIIDDDAFSGNTELAKVVLPEDTISIGENAFAGCMQLANITLPDTLITIKEGAFSDCVALTEITIPENVTTIGTGVFKGATSLKDITFVSELPSTVTKEFLKSLPPNVKNINVPDASREQLKKLLTDANLTGISISNVSLVSNSLPLLLNPYRARSQIMVYTKPTIEALAAGDALPVTKETSWSPAPPGALLKSLGRYIVVMGPNHLQRYKFCNVQYINGVTTEGVSGTSDNGWNTGWICIWSADGVAPIL